MQWKNTWEDTKQYIQNDTVVSASDKAVYILTVTSEIGNGDPEVNENWFPITTATTGITDLEARDGLTNIGSGTNPIIENTGIISVRPGLNISISGTANNPIINGTLPIPRFCKLFDGATATLSGFPIMFNSAGVMTFTGASLSPIFNNYLQNGAPDPNGAFYIDLTSISALVLSGTAAPVVPPNDFMTIGVRDLTANVTTPIGFQKFWTGRTYIYPFSFNFGIVKLNVASVRTAGVNIVNAFVFSQPSNGFSLSTRFSSLGIISAVYSPTG
jgi:hypothetical protein